MKLKQLEVPAPSMSLRDPSNQHVAKPIELYNKQTKIEWEIGWGT